MKEYPPFTIQVDTREKNPFTFKWAISHGHVAKIVEQKMNAGDYGLLSFPFLVSIERKKSVGELYNNLISKDKYERFIREMERLKTNYKYSYIVIEQNWDALWDKSNFKFASRNKNYAGSIILTHLIHIEADYNIHIHFAGDKAEALTLKILQKHYERAMREAEKNVK